jgi:hypothetical protein
MKTLEQILSEHSKNYGAIEHNPRAVVKASEALDAMKECAKQILEEYTNRIVENAFVTHKETSNGDEYIVNKESITSQLPLMLKELGI